MKKILFFLSLLVFAAVSFNSCTSDDGEKEFEESLLVGKWLQDSSRQYYRYDADYTGKAWNEADGVTEEDAQSFTWELVKDELTRIHIMEMGGKVPKYYQVLSLTATTLQYRDNTDNKTYTFTKQ